MNEDKNKNDGQKENERYTNNYNITIEGSTEQEQISSTSTYKAASY